jgi:hypothetical protein
MTKLAVLGAAPTLPSHARIMESNASEVCNPFPSSKCLLLRDSSKVAAYTSVRVLSQHHDTNQLRNSERAVRSEHSQGLCLLMSCHQCCTQELPFDAKECSCKANNAYSRRTGLLARHAGHGHTARATGLSA